MERREVRGSSHVVSLRQWRFGGRSLGGLWPWMKPLSGEPLLSVGTTKV
jgi:hypothetical protein